MKNLGKITTVLLIVGAFNWGLVGLWEFNLVDYVFGDTWLDRALYVLIGFSAVYQIVNWKKKG